MNDLPDSIRNSIPGKWLADAERWWCSLSDEDRNELRKLCDVRKETFLFESFPLDGSGVKVIGGKFLYKEKDCSGIEEWGDDYFDYLMGNPELVLVHDPVHRTFHIGCTRHAKALECYRAGQIPSDFRCPFESTRCRMQAIRGDAGSARLVRVIDAAR